MTSYPWWSSSTTTTSTPLPSSLHSYLTLDVFLAWALNPDVTLDSRLGNKSDIFHHNNENNQLERRVWPPRDVY